MGRISMPQGKGSQLHNRRDYDRIGHAFPDNIDRTKSDQNITLVDKNIREAYDEIFGEALQKYNDKQKRKDRKIKNYYDHISKSKNGEKHFYEDIIQWGRKDDFVNPKTREKAKESLLEYAKEFEERNPNLKLIGAYLHMDEASPHLHLDYIPVAHGYKNGLETRNSLDKAMKEMGYIPDKESRKNNATKLWKEHERVVFSEICRNHGLEVEEERRARGSLSVDEYKEARDQMMGGLVKEKEDIVREIAPLKELQVDINEINTKGKKMPFNIVLIKKSELETLKEQAKSYIANRDEIDNIRQRTAAAYQRELIADNREHELESKTLELAVTQQEITQQYQRQLNLNNLLEESERELKAKERKIEELAKEVVRLTDIRDRLYRQVDNLKERLRGAYESITAIVKAVGMLKWSKDEYGANLTEKQDNLIDGVSAFGINLAKEADYDDLADDMEDHIGISNDIMKFIEPPENERDDWDIDL